MITGLDHVALAIPRGGADEARAFYGGVLGLKEIPKPGGLAPGGCWFDLGTAQLHLAVEEHFTPVRKGHPAFLVDDIDAIAAALRDAGGPVEEDMRVPGVRRIYTADPFGNRIEIIRDGLGFSQRVRSPGTGSG